MGEDFNQAVRMHRAMSFLLGELGYPTLALGAEENAQAVEKIAQIEASQ